jgi:hypothetical protein
VRVEGLDEPLAAVPSSGPPGPGERGSQDLGLCADTRVQYLSDLVRSRPGMATAVREIAVQLWFRATLLDPAQPGRERRVLLLPSHGAGHRPIGVRDLLWFAAFPTIEDRSRFLELVAEGPDLFHLRVTAAAELLDAVEGELLRGNPHKALKRLHQAFDLLAPGLDELTRADLEAALAMALSSPAATLLHDLDQTAGKLAPTAARPVPLALLATCGTLRAVEAAYAPRLDALAVDAPSDVAVRLAALRALLGRAVAGAPAWPQVSRDAAALAAELGPGEEDVRRWVAVLREVLARAPGERALYDADDATLDVR